MFTIAEFFIMWVLRDNLIQLPHSVDKDSEARRGGEGDPRCDHRHLSSYCSLEPQAGARGSVIHFCAVVMIVSYLHAICTFINMVSLITELTLFFIPKQIYFERKLL